MSVSFFNRYNTPVNHVYQLVLAMVFFGSMSIAAIGHAQTSLSIKQFNHLQKLAKKGVPEAQYNLGLFHDQRQNYGLALQWYKRAANAGIADAQNNLATLYQFGNGTPLNYKKAKEWYFFAAKQGSELAQMNLASLYLDKETGDVSPTEAAKWFDAAAKQGNVEAQYELAYMLFEGADIAKNPKKSFQLFLKAAEKDYENANFFVGWMYMTGTGVKQNGNKAARWLKRSAKKGNQQAIYNLGVLYADGIGVKPNPEKAIKWFKQTKGEDLALAEYNIATMYANMGNQQLTEQWLLKSAAKNYPDALFELAELRFNRAKTQLEIEKAQDWYVRACENGLVKGCDHYTAIRKGKLTPLAMQPKPTDNNALFVEKESNTFFQKKNTKQKITGITSGDFRLGNTANIIAKQADANGANRLGQSLANEFSYNNADNLNMVGVTPAMISTIPLPKKITATPPIPANKELQAKSNSQQPLPLTQSEKAQQLAEVNNALQRKLPEKQIQKENQPKNNTNDSNAPNVARITTNSTKKTTEVKNANAIQQSVQKGRVDMLIPNSLKTSAEQGNAEAQYSVAMLYLNSADNKNPNSAEKGVMWLAKAGQQRYGKASLKLATIHEQGSYGVVKNKEAARAWYLAACEQKVQQGCIRYTELIEF